MNSRATRNFSFLLWSIITVVLVCLELNKNLNSILLTILGSIIGLIGIGRIYNSFRGWLFFDFGLAVWVYPILKLARINFASNIKFILIVFCFVITMQLFFDDSLRNKKAKKRCTIPFEAKCISFTQAGVSSYVPIYRYHIDGRTNMFYGNNLSSINPKLGDIITVFVNKKNENDVYCPTAKAILMIRYIVGFLILSFSTGALVIL